MKEKYHVIALLGIGGLAVLWYLSRQTPSPASNGSQIADDNVAQAPSYPNVQPIQPSDFNVGGSPLELTYNTNGPLLPSVNVGDSGGLGIDNGCGCVDSECEAGDLTTVNNIPPAVFQSATANLNSWSLKTTASPSYSPPMANVDESVNI
jgi:hypothetical protein